MDAGPSNGLFAIPVLPAIEWIVMVIVLVALTVNSSEKFWLVLY